MGKPVKLAITLDPEDVDGGRDMDANTSDNYDRVDMPFNSFTTEFFEGSNADEQMQRMLALIKTQRKNP